VIESFDKATKEEVVAELEATKTKFQSLIEERESRLAQVEFELAQLKRMIFGAKSERFVPAAHPSQLNLLEEPATETSIEESVIVDKHERKKKKEKHPVRQLLPASLPREVITIYPEGFDEHTTQKPIGEEITEVLEEIPGRLFVKKYVRLKFAKSNGEGVAIGVLPSRPIEKGLFGTLLLTRIIIEKYCDHLPLYRQLERMKRAGIKLAYSTLADVPAQLGELLVPLYNELIKQALSSKYIGVDETPHPVLDKDVKQKTHRGYFWVYQAVEQRLVLFDYKPGRGKRGPAELLKNFKGFLQTDGYQVYEEYGRREDITLVGCMAHARRYFDKALDSHREKAQHVIELLQKVYEVEREIKLNALTEQEILALRNERSLPVLTEIKLWLDDHLYSVTPQSPLGKAIGYMHSRWENLTRYLDHAFLQIDNNLVENAIRPTVLGRKNYLFSGSHEAAQRSAMFYSFIGSCKMNNINPEEWLADVLEKISDTKTSQLSLLLPNNWKK
jgi:transposase